jgi:hypothetical protein
MLRRIAVVLALAALLAAGILEVAWGQTQPGAEIASGRAT